eukprot:gene16646-18983_t
MTSKVYEKFDISPRWGFLTDSAIMTAPLPADFDIFAQIIANLENTDGIYYRSLVDQLANLGHPQEYYIELAKKQTYDVQKKVYSLFTFMVQKYIRCMGKDHQIEAVPFELGLIWHHCSLTFNLPTVTTYSALVLSNWALTDPTLFPTLENLTAVHGISGLQDEIWFYRIHIAIEYTGGQILQEMFDIEETTATTESTIRFLQKMRQVLLDIAVLLGKMRAGCDPKTYWNDVRIFLGGYTPDNGLPNGINIAHTSIKDIKFGGGSGAQSSLIQSFDEFLGVEHTTDHAREFLRIQRTYMPTKHAAYLAELSTHRPLREIVLQYNDEAVTTEYNAVMMALGKFRAAHYRIVYEYIVFFTSAAKEATTRGDYASAALINKNNIFGEGGTGGTVLKMLEEYRKDTVATQIKAEVEDSGV